MTSPNPNPLVAQRQDSTEWDTGLGIVESVNDTVDGIQSGSWIEGGLGLAGTGLEALSLVVDPIGTLVSYGVSWLIEHVKPLSDALDWLAGDADTIASYAQTWRNVSNAVTGALDSFTGAVAQQTGQWVGVAGDAYRAHAGRQAESLESVATAAGGVGDVVEIVGVLVGTVREIVRDLIAECVATLVARIPQWLAEEGLTLGLATPHVVASAVALISKWVRRVTDVITNLVRSIEKLRPLLRKLDEIWQALRDGFRRLGDTGTGPSTPGPGPDPVRSPTALPDATSPQSTSPQSGTPSSPQPGVPESTTPQSGTPRPTTPQSGTPDTTTPQSGDTGTPPTRSGGGEGQPPPDEPGSPAAGDGPRRLPEDRNGAQTLERIDESRVRRDDNGLITEVDGRPVNEYLNDVMRQRADELRAMREQGQISARETGPVTSVGIDRQTGEIVEAVNGRPGNTIPEDQLHPVLRERLEQMRANGPYPQYNADGTPQLDRNGNQIRSEFPHPDDPLRHAEVKAINDLLWKRGPDADASALDQFRVDNSFPFDSGGPRSAPCCPNCHRMLDGVPSNAGRLTHRGGHPDSQFIPE